MVKVSGLPTYYTTMYDAGSVMRRTEINYIPESISKIAGIVVGGLLMALLLVKDLARGVSNFSRPKQTYEAGFRVVNLDSYSGN